MDPADAAKVAAMDQAAAAQTSMSPAAGATGANPAPAANPNVHLNLQSTKTANSILSLTMKVIQYL